MKLLAVLCISGLAQALPTEQSTEQVKAPVAPPAADPNNEQIVAAEEAPISTENDEEVTEQSEETGPGPEGNEAALKVQSPSCFEDFLGSGRCRAAFKRYYFDTKNNACAEFIYGGCHGNGNNFVSSEECMEACDDGETEVWSYDRMRAEVKNLKQAPEVKEQIAKREQVKEDYYTNYYDYKDEAEADSEDPIKK